MRLAVDSVSRGFITDSPFPLPLTEIGFYAYDTEINKRVIGEFGVEISSGELFCTITSYGKFLTYGTLNLNNVPTLKIYFIVNGVRYETADIPATTILDATIDSRFDMSEVGGGGGEETPST